MNYLQKKKLAFMSIVNKVKGFVRTITGASPLVLPDCVGGANLINYLISGDSVQDGTPIPNVPVEIESVGDYDEASGKYKIPIVVTNEKGDSESAVIYLNEPLRKIGNYADYIDFENGKVVRNVSKVDLGLQSWTLAKTFGACSDYLYYMSTVTNMLYKYSDSPTPLGLCTHYSINPKYGGWSIADTYDGITINASTGLINIKDARFLEDVEAFTESLQGIYFYYVLTEPTEELINLPPIPTFKGTTILSANTTIQPSNMSATYYSTSKE